MKPCFFCLIYEQKKPHTFKKETECKSRTLTFLWSCEGTFCER